MTIVTSIAVVASGLTFAAVAAPAEAKSEPFDAGHLISDTLMFDGGSMTVAQIQSFLNGKVKTCATNPERACLKDIKVTTNDRPATSVRCLKDIEGKSNQSAAQVIYTVAMACDVSPKVLLVTLQKEQGLVTSTSPTARMYKYATGNGCADSAPCVAEKSGFFNQVYYAGRSYQAYANNYNGNFSYLRPGVNAISYHPDAAKKCGTKSVSIDNVATSALYIYTPYTPNAAALANMGGTGDKCSSYGNRNFWKYYNAWFGNSGAGDYLVTRGSSTSLVIDGARWALPSSTPRLAAAIAPIDAPAPVSAAYLGSLSAGGTVGLVARSSTGSAYVLASGNKYTLDSCTVATSIGFSCANAPVLPKAALGELTTSTALAGKDRIKVQTASKQNYVLEGGQRREFVSSANVTGAALGSAIQLDAALLAPVAYGVPYLPGNDLVAVRDTKNYVTSTGGATYLVPATTVTQTDADEWFGIAKGALDVGSVGELPAVTGLPHLFTAGGKSYVLATTGKIELTAPSQWSTSIPALDEATAASIPTVSSISGPVFVSTLTSSKIYLVANGERRAVASTADRDKLAKSLGIARTVKKLPTASVAAIAMGDSIVPAGTVVRTAKSGPYFLIDGDASRIPLSAAAAKEFAGSATVRTVTLSALDGYPVADSEQLPGVTCGSTSYLAIAGVLRKVSAADAAQYGSAYGFTALDTETCAGLTRSGAMGVFLKYSTKYYIVENGERSLISTSKYKSLSKGLEPARTVSKYFLQLLPIAT